jgi:hypothetical protein
MVGCPSVTASPSDEIQPPVAAVAILGSTTSPVRPDTTRRPDSRKMLKRFMIASTGSISVPTR